MRHVVAPCLSMLLALGGPSSASAQNPPPPEIVNDLGTTSLGGDSQDVGTPDPINPAEGGGSGAPEAFMPDFNDSAPTTTAPTPPAQQGTGNAESGGSMGGDEMIPETSSAESPAPSARPRRRWTGGPLAKPRALSPLANPDDPDFKREQVFFDVYKKFNEEPTPVESWDQVAGSRASEAYKVQRGDTLWDLSGTLFGDPGFWPKIWALNNDQVHNPHEIETWMQIRFFPGDMNEAPAVTVADASGQMPANVAAVGATTEEEPMGEGETAARPAMTTDSIKVDKMGPDPKVDATLIPPAKRRPPIVRQIPNSIPFYRFEEVNLPPLDFERYFPTPKPIRHEMPLAYYMADRVVTGVGKIEETEIGGQTASEFQFVFVTVSDASPKIFTVLRDRGVVPDVRAGSSKKGALVEVQGEIEIIEPVSDRNVYRAIVRRNLNQVEVGSYLVPGKIENVSVADGSPQGDASLMIIGAQFTNRRAMVDAGGFVFLNGGSSQGISNGQIFPLYSNQRLRNPETKAKNNDRIVGHVRIVHTANQFSTGFVTRLWDDVFIGDATFNAAGKISRSSVSADEAAQRSHSGGTSGASAGDDTDEFGDFGNEGSDSGSSSGDDLTL